MAFDPRELIDLIPLALSALHPGSPEYAAFMQGYQQSQQRLQGQQRQQRLETQDQEYRQAQIRNLDADNQRAEKQLALQRLSASRGEGQHVLDALQQHPETALPAGTDPLKAQNELVIQQLGAQQAYGVPPGTPQAPLPNMTQLVSEGKRRRARAVMADYDKSRGEQAAEADASESPNFGEFQGMTYRQIREIAQSLPPPKKTPTPRQAPQAGSFEAFILAKYGEHPTPEQILEGRKLYQQADDRPNANNPQAGQLPANIQRLVDAKSRGFDAQPTVKSVQKQAEAVSFANSLDINSKNPADDQALIYAFAKAMDPDSVVREGEYATVQKYSQSWLQSFGFNAMRILSNSEFLSPSARANLKATIQKKYAAGRAQYDNIRKSYASQIDKITGKPGSGEEWLVDYAGAFPASEPAAPANELPPGVTVKRR